MSSLRVLMTNMSLWFRSGTELYVRDVSKTLATRGHSPVVFSTQLGEVAEEIQRIGVPVIRNLAQSAVVPDVIHGQHNLETIAAALRYPAVPVVFVCHDCSVWHDTPPPLPSIRRCIAVDAPTRDRLLLKHGVKESQLKVIPNGIDLQRFPVRKALPPVPRKTLLFSSYIQPDSVREIEAACRMHGLKLDKVGAVFGKICDQPERILPHYDLVFAKGRCAVEAMACGSAVILCDQIGAGPMMTLERLHRNGNFSPGRRWFSDPVERHSLAQKIAEYNASDAMAISRWIREHRDLERTTDSILETYHEAIADRHHVDLTTFLQAASDNATWWAENWSRLLQEHVASSVTPPEPISEGPQVHRLKRQHRSLRQQFSRLCDRMNETFRRAS